MLGEACMGKSDEGRPEPVIWGFYNVFRTLCRISIFSITSILIADSGATKCEWRLVGRDKKKTILTQGISPYFLDELQITVLLTKELLPKLGKTQVKELFFYGTGLSNADNVKIIKSAEKPVPESQNRNSD
jgi:hypothetical protein